MAGSPASGADRGARFAAGCFVVLLALLTYANTFDARFAWDDVSSFLYHEHVQDPGAFFQLFREDQHAFGRGQGNFYRPLLAVTFMADYAISAASTLEAERPAPLAFHVSNAIWHALAALGLFALLTRLRVASAVRLTATSIYAVHPMHTEAVAYVSGRADSMSAAFMFAGIVLALSGATRGGRIVTGIASLLCYGCALLSKESSFIYPVLLLIGLLAAPREGGESEPRGTASRYAPWFASLLLLGGYGALRMTVLNFAAAGGGLDVSLGQRLIETAQSFAQYMGLLFYPANLHMERTLDGATMASTLAGVGLLAACVLFTINTAFSGHTRAAAGMAWFLASWFPISGVFTLNAPMAEHWMYVPMAGFWWALAEMLPRSDHPWARWRHPRALYPIGWAAAVWILMLLAISVDRNLDWRTNEAIFRATLAENPNTTRVHFNLGVVYEEPPENMPGARRHYQEMMAIFNERRQQGLQSGYRDEEAEALLSLGNMAFLEHKYPEAARHYDRILSSMQMNDAIRPVVAQAAFQLGRMYLETGDAQRAQVHFKRALQDDPLLEEEFKKLGNEN